MIQSDSLANLAAALCKAQAEMKNAIKDANNPFFHSKYADLASVVEASRPFLVKNGLSVVQCTDGDWLWTMLLHESGEWIKGRIELKPMRQEKGVGWVESKDPQSYGSCITYARRYALAALVGVATEDDDGNAASGNKVPVPTNVVNLSSVKITKPPTAPVSAPAVVVEEELADVVVDLAPEPPAVAIEKPAPSTPAPKPAEPGITTDEMKKQMDEMADIAVDAGKYGKSGDAIQEWCSDDKFKSKCRDIAGLKAPFAIKKAYEKMLREMTDDIR
jgi:hypothetical protein